MTTEANAGHIRPDTTPLKNKEHALVKFGLDPNKIIQEDGRYWMTAKEIGKALGYNDPANSMNRLYGRHKDDLEPYRGKVNLTDHLGISHETSIFNTDGMWMFAMFAKTPKAKKFRKFIVNMLKALERQEFIHVSQVMQWKKELIELRIGKQIQNSRAMDWNKYNRMIRYRDMGLTQRETAKLLDISRDVVQQFERIARQYELKLVSGGAA